jgi:hypothetical protein
MSVNITAASLLCSPLIFSTPLLLGCFSSGDGNQRKLDGQAVNVANSVNYLGHSGFEILDTPRNLAEGKDWKEQSLEGLAPKPSSLAVVVCEYPAARTTQIQSGNDEGSNRSPARLDPTHIE